MSPRSSFSNGWVGSFFIALATAVSPLAAQYPVGPIYPPTATPNVQPPPRSLQSGEDPFQLNPFTGRFEYVPIPYEFVPGTAGTPGYAFNWHTGRFDYVPFTPLNSGNSMEQTRQVTPGNYLDGRIDASAGAGAGAGVGAGAQENAQTASATIPPTAIAQPPIAPPSVAAPPPPRKSLTTKPATAPTIPSPPPAMRVRIAGRWEFDYSTGRWVFVLPSD